MDRVGRLIKSWTESAFRHLPNQTFGVNRRTQLLAEAGDVDPTASHVSERVADRGSADTSG